MRQEDAEAVTIRGTVIGAEGKPIAGWVSLGREHPQRWLANLVTLKTDDGDVVIVEDLKGDSITPVTKLDVQWRAIERDPLAQLCAGEAPAPDIEVEYREAILRGGDSVTVWGEIIEYGAPDSAGDGPAFRSAGERTIARLRVRVIAYGENCESIFEGGKHRWNLKQRPITQERPRLKVKSAGLAPLAKPDAIVQADRDYHDRTARNYPLALAVAGLLVLGALAAMTRGYSEVLRAVAAVACLPLALDAVVVPRFRNGSIAPPALDTPFIAYLIAGAGTVMLSLGTNIDPRKAATVTVVSYVFAGLAIAAAGWLAYATRKRRQWISIMVKAPRQPFPLLDGVWGATDGHFGTEVMSIGATATSYGAAVKDAAGIKQRSVRTEPFTNLMYEAELVAPQADDGERRAVRVRLAHASILSTVKLDRSTGPNTGITADVIIPRMPVRALGRATSGTLIKAGEASLLVFASGLDTDVARELTRVHRRDLIAQGLALAGVACLVASFVV